MKLDEFLLKLGNEKDDIYLNYKDDIIELLGEKVDAESLFRELDKALYVYLRNAVWN